MRLVFVGTNHLWLSLSKRLYTDNPVLQYSIPSIKQSQWLKQEPHIEILRSYQLNCNSKLTIKTKLSIIVWGETMAIYHVVHHFSYVWSLLKKFCLFIFLFGIEITPMLKLKQLEESGAKQDYVLNPCQNLPKHPDTKMLLTWEEG